VTLRDHGLDSLNSFPLVSDPLDTNVCSILRTDEEADIIKKKRVWMAVPESADAPLNCP
jgi:hypothetical protein